MKTEFTISFYKKKDGQPSKVWGLDLMVMNIRRYKSTFQCSNMCFYPEDRLELRRWINKKTGAYTIVKVEKKDDWGRVIFHLKPNFK